MGSADDALFFEQLTEIIDTTENEFNNIYNTVENQTAWRNEQERNQIFFQNAQLIRVHGADLKNLVLSTTNRIQMILYNLLNPANSREYLYFALKRISVDLFINIEELIINSVEYLKNTGNPTETLKKLTDQKTKFLNIFSETKSILEVMKNELNKSPALSQRISRIQTSKQNQRNSNSNFQVAQARNTEIQYQPVVSINQAPDENPRGSIHGNGQVANRMSNAPATQATSQHPSGSPNQSRQSIVQNSNQMPRVQSQSTNTQQPGQRNTLVNSNHSGDPNAGARNSPARGRPTMGAGGAPNQPKGPGQPERKGSMPAPYQGGPKPTQNQPPNQRGRGGGPPAGGMNRAQQNPNQQSQKLQIVNAAPAEQFQIYDPTEDEELFGVKLTLTPSHTSTQARSRKSTSAEQIEEINELLDEISKLGDEDSLPPPLREEEQRKRKEEIKETAEKLEEILFTCEISQMENERIQQIAIQFVPTAKKLIQVSTDYETKYLIYFGSENEETNKIKMKDMHQKLLEYIHQCKDLFLQDLSPSTRSKINRLKNEFYQAAGISTGAIALSDESDKTRSTMFGNSKLTAGMGGGRSMTMISATSPIVTLDNNKRSNTIVQSAAPGGEENSKLIHRQKAIKEIFDSEKTYLNSLQRIIWVCSSFLLLLPSPFFFPFSLSFSMFLLPPPLVPIPIPILPL